MDTSVLAMCSVKKKKKQAKAQSQNTLLAEDETGALAIYLSFCWIWDFIKWKVLYNFKDNTV